MDDRDRCDHLSRRRLLGAGIGIGATTFLGLSPFGASGRSYARAQESPKAGGTLVAAASGDLKFDPYYRIVAAWYPYGTLYSALYNYRGPDPTRANPWIAESDEETETTLTVTLRTGVKFHHGREVTAQDIVDNIARAKDEAIGHFLSAYFVPTVEAVEAVDARTVKLTYKQPYALKRDDLATLFLLPKEDMATIETKPVGTGPFKFDSYAPGDRLELSRVSDYWQPGLPYLDHITIRILPDSQARIANLLAGDVDLIEALPESDVARLMENDQVQIAHSAEGGTWHTNVFNCAKPPLDSKLVRQALNYSLDRTKINQLAYYGLSPVTQSRYLPDNFWYHAPAATMYSFDLEKAKGLLSEAGVADGFETTIAVSESARPGSKAMAQVWAQDLATIGVTLKIVDKEQTAFYDDYFNGNYDIQAYLLGDGLFDPATAINDSSPLRPENNRANIQTQPFYDEYKKLVADGVAQIDPAARKPIYDRIQEIWAEESWAPILAFSVLYCGMSKRVQGFAMPPGGGYSLGGAWLSE